MQEIKEQKKEDFHRALLNDDFPRAEELLAELDGEDDFKLLHTLFHKTKPQKPLLEEYTGEPPRLITISTSYTCSMGCTFCIAGFHDKTRLDNKESCLSLEEFRKFLPWADEADVVSFIGNGETLESEHFFEYLKILKERCKGKIFVDVLTNGSSLNKKKIFDLIHMGIRRINFSIDGPTTLGHGAGKKTYLKKVWEKVALIQEFNKDSPQEKVKVNVVTVLDKHNLRHLSEHLREAEKHDVDELVLSLMIPRNSELYKESLLPDLSSNMKQLKEIIQNRKKSPMKVSVDGHSAILSKEPPVCRYVPYFAAFPDSTGQPFFCCKTLQIPHKQSPEYPIKRYWNSFPVRLLRYSHTSPEEGSIPVNCAECTEMSIEAFTTSLQKQFMQQEDVLYKGYTKGVALKSVQKNEDAKKVFTEALSEKGNHETRARVYLHLCEIFLMEGEHNKAMEHIRKAVYYQFNHRKAFSYLYLLSLLTGSKPYLKG